MDLSVAKHDQESELPLLTGQTPHDDDFAPDGSPASKKRRVDAGEAREEYNSLMQQIESAPPPPPPPQLEQPLEEQIEQNAHDRNADQAPTASSVWADFQKHLAAAESMPDNPDPVSASQQQQQQQQQQQTTTTTTTHTDLEMHSHEPFDTTHAEAIAEPSSMPSPSSASHHDLIARAARAAQIALQGQNSRLVHSPSEGMVSEISPMVQEANIDPNLQPVDSTPSISQPTYPDVSQQYQQPQIHDDTQQQQLQLQPHSHHGHDQQGQQLGQQLDHQQQQHEQQQHQQQTALNDGQFQSQPLPRKRRRRQRQPQIQPGEQQGYISHHPAQPYDPNDPNQHQPVQYEHYQQVTLAPRVKDETGQLTYAFGDPNVIPHPLQSQPTQVLYERARQVTTGKPATTPRRTSSGSSQRRPWSTDEENALMAGLDRVKGPHWAQILAMFGGGGSISETLKDRSQVQLKDKARNLKLFFLKNGIEVPYYLQFVTGDLKTRAPAQAARREALERERRRGEEDKAHVEGIEGMMALAGAGLSRESSTQNEAPLPLSQPPSVPPPPPPPPQQQQQQPQQPQQQQQLLQQQQPPTEGMGT